MSEKTPHPTLIKANIALFRGDRAEALRLLRQYEAERPPTVDPNHSMVLWLEAQAQTDDDMRVRLMRDLINKVDVNDAYSRMAREYLIAEESYRPQERRGNRRGVWIGGGVVVVLVAIVGGSLLFGGSIAPEATVTPSVVPTVEVTQLPDRSEPLVAPSFTARYEAGILQIAALEDGSERVVSTDTGEVLSPVAGARFYALEISFECRSGICDEPPEAVLTLQTSNEDTLTARENVAIAGEDTLEPVALGRTTRGWVVFEVPSLSRVENLVVKPSAGDEDTPPFVIELPQ